VKERKHKLKPKKHMPFWNVVRIIPTALEADWITATALGGDADGLGVSSSVYTLSDPTPRTATHKAGNGTLNAAQLAYLNGLGNDVNGYVQMPVGLEGCLVKVWDRQSQANPYNGMLTDNGLTTNPNA
jgi:hypothetical protein